MTKARTLADNFAADINGITAGTGITGGGTSGTVTITNQMATTIDAKGDLVVGTGADTFGRLGVASTAGYVLTVDSAETTGLKWSAPATGDITSVTAGTGLSGGGTAGDVTITNTMATAIDAKGDLVAGTGADTFSRLGVGANNTVLTADSATATGLKWAALPSSAPTSATSSVLSEQSTSSTTFTDLATVGPAVTVTTGTKALVIVTAWMQGDANSARSGAMGFAVSGSTTRAATLTESRFHLQAVNNNQIGASSVFLVTGLTAGSNTFTAKYCSQNPGTTLAFDERYITVIDMGS